MAEVEVAAYSYRADPLARNYCQSDAVDHLRECVALEHLAKRRCLIFVCHSLGGIIARRYLVARQAELLDDRLISRRFSMARL